MASGGRTALATAREAVRSGGRDVISGRHDWFLTGRAACSYERLPGRTGRINIGLQCTHRHIHSVRRCCKKMLPRMPGIDRPSSSRPRAAERLAGMRFKNGRTPSARLAHEAPGPNRPADRERRSAHVHACRAASMDAILTQHTETTRSFDAP